MQRTLCCLLGWHTSLSQSLTPPKCITRYQQIKTESTRTLSNFDFQWTKILYQNNLKHILSSLHFSRAKDVIKSSVVTTKKISHSPSLRKWKSNFTKLHLTHKIFRILPAWSQFLWNLTFIFSDFHEKFSLVLLQMIYYIFSPWKM